MTGAIASHATSPSRRALLAGVLGGIGAWAMSAVGQASPARAADGNVVHVGDELIGSTVTKITNATNNNVVLAGSSNGGGAGVLGTSGSGVGVQASSNSGEAVVAISTSSTGVYAVSGSGLGVYAQSDSDYGVYAFSGASNLPAVGAKSFGNSTGLLGYSGPGTLPAGRDKTGVFGYANQDSTAKGVWGQSPNGRAIMGSSDTGWAGYFNGRVFAERYVELAEVGNPSAPPSNRARLFIRDNGSGKTQLCVRFTTGGARVIATQP